MQTHTKERCSVPLICVWNFGGQLSQEDTVAKELKRANGKRHHSDEQPWAAGEGGKNQSLGEGSVRREEYTT